MQTFRLIVWLVLGLAILALGVVCCREAYLSPKGVVSGIGVGGAFLFMIGVAIVGDWFDESAKWQTGLEARRRSCATSRRSRGFGEGAERGRGWFDKQLK